MKSAGSWRLLYSLAGKGALSLAIGLLMVGWLLETPPGLLGKADAVGYAVCHRIETRSFHLGERQMPLCARCSGMFLGALLGLAFQAVRFPRYGGMPKGRSWILPGLLAAAFAVDGLNSYLSLFPGVPILYEPQNGLRLFTGTGMGITISMAVFPAFNQSVWKDWLPSPALASFRSLATLVLLALGLDLIVLTQNPLVLYPLALVSAAGVLVLLTMVYSMVWLMFLHAENRFEHISQMGWFLVAGLGTAMVQIIGLDLIRYFFTGTWDGFHLG